MSDMLGRFVTAISRQKGSVDARQGAVISENPLIIRGKSGVEYNYGSEYHTVLVANPPEICIGCDLPLGRLCIKCEEKLNELDVAMSGAGLEFTSIEAQVSAATNESEGVRI